MAVSTGIFADNATPAGTWNEGFNATFATRFSPTTNGYITGIQYYHVPGDTGNKAVRLYSDAGTLLGGKVVPSPTGRSGWQSIALDTPIAVTSGTWYRAAIYTETDGTNHNYAYDGSNIWGSGGTTADGLLSYPPSGGSYIAGDTAPSNSTTNAFFVDPVFDTSSGGGSGGTTTGACVLIGV